MGLVREEGSGRPLRLTVEREAVLAGTQHQIQTIRPQISGKPIAANGQRPVRGKALFLSDKRSFRIRTDLFSGEGPAPNSDLRKRPLKPLDVDTSFPTTNASGGLG